MIEHQSAQKIALDDIVVDCVGNGLKYTIQRNYGQFLEMGLKMPSEGDCIWTQQDDEGILDDYYLSRMMKESWTITTSAG